MVETYYIHLEFKNKNGNWSINLPFVCDKCGVCCTLEDFLNAGKIHGTPELNPEAYAKFAVLKDELGKLFEESEEKYEKYVETAKCPFQTGKICSIYAIRPDGCRQFPNTPLACSLKTAKHLTGSKNNG